MKKENIIILICFFAVISTLTYFRGKDITFGERPVPEDFDAPGPLVVYCDPALKGPVEFLSRSYELAHGIRIQCQYERSATMNEIDSEVSGDVFVMVDRERIGVTNFTTLDHTQPLVLVSETVDPEIQPATPNHQAAPFTALVGRANGSPRPKMAAAYVDFLADPEGGLTTFREHGFVGTSD